MFDNQLDPEQTSHRCNRRPPPSWESHRWILKTTRPSSSSSSFTFWEGHLRWNSEFSRRHLPGGGELKWHGRWDVLLVLNIVTKIAEWPQTPGNDHWSAFDSGAIFEKVGQVMYLLQTGWQSRPWCLQVPQDAGDRSSTLRNQVPLTCQFYYDLGEDFARWPAEGQDGGWRPLTDLVKLLPVRRETQKSKLCQNESSQVQCTGLYRMLKGQGGLIHDHLMAISWFAIVS